MPRQRTRYSRRTYDFPEGLPPAAEAIQGGVRPVVVGDSPPSGKPTATPYGVGLEEGARPNYQHRKALLDLANSLDLGPPVYGLRSRRTGEGGRDHEGQETQEGRKHFQW